VVGAPYNYDPIVHQPEEAGQVQVGDHDHHAEQDRNGIEIDRPVCLVERHYTQNQART